MTAYATASDLYECGVPPGALSFPSRLVGAVSVANNTLELSGHNLPSNSPVQLTVDDGGELPGGLALNTVYFAAPVVGSDSLLRLALVADGPAIDLTTSGVAPIRLVRSIATSIDQQLAFHSRWVDTLLTGHVVPLVAPFPEWVVGVVAKRAARSLIRQLGLSGLQHIIDEADSVERDALRMAPSGIQLRDARATAPANLCKGASPIVSSTIGETVIL